MKKIDQADAIARIGKAFHDLPVLPDQQETVNAIAVFLVTTADAVKGNDLPMVSHATVKRAKKELKKLDDAVCKLINRLEATHGTAIAAIEKQKPDRHRLNIEADLLSLSTAIRRAYRDIPEPPVEGTGQKKAAREITNCVASYYTRLTGKNPTRVYQDGKAGGHFVCLLRNVFDALEINASPEAQARAFMEKCP